MLTEGTFCRLAGREYFEQSTGASELAVLRINGTGSALWESSDLGLWQLLDSYKDVHIVHCISVQGKFQFGKQSRRRIPQLLPGRKSFPYAYLNHTAFLSIISTLWRQFLLHSMARTTFESIKSTRMRRQASRQS